METVKEKDTSVIIEARTEEEWNEAEKNKQPAFCYFENSTTKLYNLFATKILNKGKDTR